MEDNIYYKIVVPQKLQNDILDIAKAFDIEHSNVETSETTEPLNSPLTGTEFGEILISFSALISTSNRAFDFFVKVRKYLEREQKKKENKSRVATVRVFNNKSKKSKNIVAESTDADLKNLL